MNFFEKYPGKLSSTELEQSALCSRGRGRDRSGSSLGEDRENPAAGTAVTAGTTGVAVVEIDGAGELGLVGVVVFTLRVSSLALPMLCRTDSSSFVGPVLPLLFADGNGPDMDENNLSRSCFLGGGELGLIWVCSTSWACCSCCLASACPLRILYHWLLNCFRSDSAATSCSRASRTRRSLSASVVKMSCRSDCVWRM